MSLNETNEESKVPPTAKFVRASDYKAIYTNFIQCGITAFDVSLHLGETAGVEEGNQFTVEQKARVVMAPAEAKVLLIFLANTIQQYEKRFGSIVIPTDAMPDGVPPSSEAGDGA